MKSLLVLVFLLFHSTSYAAWNFSPVSFNQMLVEVGNVTVEISFDVDVPTTSWLANFGDDLKECFFHAGTAQTQITLVLADTQIKYETFLEYLNSLLLTGEVPGLFSKEEIALAMAEVQDVFEKECVLNGVQSTPEDLKRYLINKVRDRLHVILCMSPAHPLFATRARRFPGIFAACSINLFLSWPIEALVSVATVLVGDQMESIECTADEKTALLEHMGEVHTLAMQMCDEYKRKTRRMRVHQTPKSYLAFLGDYRNMYTRKLKEVKQKASNVTLGLERLEKAAEDVASMSTVLEVERGKLQTATEETNAMLGSLEVSSLEAKNESDMVRGIKEACESDATRISKEKELCLEDLAKAQPFVDDANSAIDKACAFVAFLTRAWLAATSVSLLTSIDAMAIRSRSPWAARCACGCVCVC